MRDISFGLYFIFMNFFKSQDYEIQTIFKQIYFLYVTLTDITTPSLCRPGSNGNEEVTLKTVASPSDVV